MKVSSFIQIKGEGEPLPKSERAKCKVTLVKNEDGTSELRIRNTRTHKMVVLIMENKLEMDELGNMLRGEKKSFYVPNRFFVQEDLVRPLEDGKVEVLIESKMNNEVDVFEEDV